MFYSISVGEVPTGFYVCFFLTYFLLCASRVVQIFGTHNKSQILFFFLLRGISFSYLEVYGNGMEN